ncbi:MAG: glycosyltransferase [Bacteroidetes bacterium]|nr:glycosyltransferase [Bacteroidota bacterium]
MKISIVTPTFNSETTILNNVNSILNQTYSNFEHILIDNESSDNTLNLAKKEYRLRNSTEKLRIIREKDKGIAEAFNKGIEASSGEIIGILNSDDRYYDENILNRIIDVFKNENCLYAHGNIYFQDSMYGSNIRKPLLCPVTEAMPYNHPTMFFRKEVYQEYGNYDTNYLLVMDFEFICRLIKQVDDFYNKGIYLKGEPLVTMAAGGASWENELDSIEETRKELKKYDYWNFDARKNYILRKLRTKIKSWLSVMKMENVVTRWRKRKWEN